MSEIAYTHEEESFSYSQIVIIWFGKLSQRLKLKVLPSTDAKFLIGSWKSVYVYKHTCLYIHVHTHSVAWQQSLKWQRSEVPRWCWHHWRSQFTNMSQQPTCQKLPLTTQGKRYFYHHSTQALEAVADNLVPAHVSCLSRTDRSS